MGAEAVKELLQGIDVAQLRDELTAELEGATGQKRVRLLKRLDVVDAFYHSGNKLEWMILDAIPVIPPDSVLWFSLTVADLLPLTLTTFTEELLTETIVLKDFLSLALLKSS